MRCSACCMRSHTFCHHHLQSKLLVSNTWSGTTHVCACVRVECPGKLRTFFVRPSRASLAVAEFFWPSVTHHWRVIFKQIPFFLRLCNHNVKLINLDTVVCHFQSPLPPRSSKHFLFIWEAESVRYELQMPPGQPLWITWLQEVEPISISPCKTACAFTSSKRHMRKPPQQ